MNKTLLKTALFAIVTSFAMSGQTWAHHPSEDMNPNFDFVDGQISEMHIEIIDEMLEDGDSMISSRSMGGSVTQTQDPSGSATSSGPGANRRQ
jgi:hypothetical protein